MEDNNIKIDVIKRSGKKVDFNGEKIAIAIKKGFDGTPNNKYTMVDSNKVYLKVLDKIKDKYKDKSNIKIEEIQDLIEESLQELKYKDVYEAFSKYRERRAESRRIFYSKQHKLMKAVESLSFKEANEESNANSTGTMFEYGSIIATEFAKSYLVKSKFVEAHDSGQINIDNMDYIPMGSVKTCNINLDKLFEKGFASMYGYVRTPNDIMTYSILTSLAINACSGDQYGGVTISAFDYYLAPGVLKTFKKVFKNTLDSYLDVLGLTKLVNYKTLMRQISNLKTIDIKLETFKSIYKNSSTVEMLLRKAYQVAYTETENRTYQAMEALIHNLNTMPAHGGATVAYSAINLGTDTTTEGRMITKNYLLALEAGVGHGMMPRYPITIFKVKEGINLNNHDVNYDLLKLAYQVVAKGNKINFSFIDANQGKHNAIPLNEVAYSYGNVRILEDVTDKKDKTVTGRGNLASVTINLPRLGLKYGINLNERKSPDLKGFNTELESIMELCKDELLERFEIECSKKASSFPFLLGVGAWNNGETLQGEDRIRRVLKHGTLSIGFTGLEECIIALTGKDMSDEDSYKLGLKIVKGMNDIVNKYAKENSLNFNLVATEDKNIDERFLNLDKAIYGSVKDITNKERYTSAFYIPTLNNSNRIKKESAFHEYTHGGHITYVYNKDDNAETIEKLVREMYEDGTYYASILRMTKWYK